LGINRVICRAPVLCVAYAQPGRGQILSDASGILHRARECRHIHHARGNPFPSGAAMTFDPEDPWAAWLAIAEARKLIREREEAMVDALARKVEAEMVEAFFGFRPDWAPPVTPSRSN
jgi:hypothetical protein